MSVGATTELKFADERRLDTSKALELIEFFGSAKNWKLSPMFDGVFDSLDSAKQYVLANPGHPLMIIIPRPNDLQCESFLVHHYKGSYYLDDDSIGGLCSSAMNVQAIPRKVQSIFEILFGKDECLPF